MNNLSRKLCCQLVEAVVGPTEILFGYSMYCQCFTYFANNKGNKNEPTTSEWSTESEVIPRYSCSTCM